MVSQSSGRQGSPWMILDFPGGGRFGWDGCRASGGGAAGGSASLGCFGFFFGGHLFPWSPASLPAFGIIQWEPLSLELALDCPSGDPRSGRQDVLGLGRAPSPRAPARDPSSSPLLSTPPSPLALLGAEGIGWKRLSEVIPIPGSAEVSPGEAGGLAGFSSPFPPATHSGISSRALSEHCLQHLLPRQGPDLCQDLSVP